MLTQAAADVVGALTDAGLSADVDPAKVSPPGVWVTVDRVSPEFLSGDGTVQFACRCVVPDSAYPAVLELLDTVLFTLLDQPDLVVVDDIIPEAVIMPDGPTPLPAYRVTVQAPYTRSE